ncbi:hypothetical protein CR513_19902, partial [Mucuna pruriens]
MLLLQEFDVEITDKKGAKNAIADHLSRRVFERANSADDSCITMERPKLSKKDWKAMPSTIFGMILTYGGCAMIKSRVGAFQNPRSSQSSTFVTQRLKAAIMDQCGQPEKSLTVGYTSPPYIETHTSLSQPANSAKKLEFGVPKALINDQGSHFCNRAMAMLLEKYGVVIELLPLIILKPTTKLKSSIWKLKSYYRRWRIRAKTIGAASWRMLCGCIEQLTRLH